MRGPGFLEGLHDLSKKGRFWLTIKIKQIFYFIIAYQSI